MVCGGGDQEPVRLVPTAHPRACVYQPKTTKTRRMKRSPTGQRPITHTRHCKFFKSRTYPHTHIHTHIHTQVYSCRFIRTITIIRLLFIIILRYYIPLLLLHSFIQRSRFRYGFTIFFCPFEPTGPGTALRFLFLGSHFRKTMKARLGEVMWHKDMAVRIIWYLGKHDHLPLRTTTDRTLIRVKNMKSV